MDTKALIIQSDGTKTNIFIYGAKSAGELLEYAYQALDVDNCAIYYIEDKSILAKALTA
ncbi:MAG: hypothetical protein ABFC57_03245 [Veillonellales bacterium]